jgi:hypothetical protein
MNTPGLNGDGTTQAKRPARAITRKSATPSVSIHAVAVPCCRAVAMEDMEDPAQHTGLFLFTAPKVGRLNAAV